MKVCVCVRAVFSSKQARLGVTAGVVRVRRGRRKCGDDCHTSPAGHSKYSVIEVIAAPKTGPRAALRAPCCRAGLLRPLSVGSLLGC